MIASLFPCLYHIASPIASPITSYMRAGLATGSTFQEIHGTHCTDSDSPSRNCCCTSVFQREISQPPFSAPLSITAIFKKKLLQAQAFHPSHYSDYAIYMRMLSVLNCMPLNSDQFQIRPTLLSLAPIPKCPHAQAAAPFALAPVLPITIDLSGPNLCTGVTC